MRKIHSACFPFIARTLLCGLALALAGASGSSATAQEPGGKFTEHRGLEKPQQRDKSTFLAICSRNGGVITNQEVFDKFLNFELAEFTYPEALGDLPQKRQLLQRYLQGAGSAEDLTAHTILRKRILEQMTKMAGPTYHPYVRVNAVLVLNDLNSKEKLSLREQPVPDADALTALLAMLKDPKQLEAVKAAALLGVLRHVEFSVDDKNKLAIQEAVRPFLTTTNHDWLRRRSIQVVGALGVVGRDGENARLLLEVMGNPKESLNMRCEAARALGSLDFIAGPKINFDTASRILCGLMAEVIKQNSPPSGGAWTYQQTMAFQHQLAKLEVGLKGLPDPNFKPTSAAPEPPAIRGMMLAMTPDNAQRKKLETFIENQLNPLTKALYDTTVNEKNVEFHSKQIIDWVAANPLENREVMAGKPDLNIPNTP